MTEPTQPMMLHHPLRGVEVDWSKLSPVERIVLVDALDSQGALKEGSNVEQWARETGLARASKMREEIEGLRASLQPEGFSSDDAGLVAKEAFDKSYECGRDAANVLDVVFKRPDDHAVGRKRLVQLWTTNNQAYRLGVAKYTSMFTLHTTELAAVQDLERAHLEAIQKRHAAEIKQYKAEWQPLIDAMQSQFAQLSSPVEMARNKAELLRRRNEVLLYNVRKSGSVRNLGFSPDIGDGAPNSQRGSFHLDAKQLDYLRKKILPILAELADKDAGIVHFNGEHVPYARMLFRRLESTQDLREINVHDLARVFTLYNRAVPPDWHDKIGYLADMAAAHREVYDEMAKQVNQQARIRMLEQQEAASAAKSQSMPTAATAAADAPSPAAGAGDSSQSNGAATEDSHTGSGTLDARGSPSPQETPPGDRAESSPPTESGGETAALGPSRS